MVGSKQEILRSLRIEYVCQQNVFFINLLHVDLNYLEPGNIGQAGKMAASLDSHSNTQGSILSHSLRIC